MKQKDRRKYEWFSYMLILQTLMGSPNGGNVFSFSFTFFSESLAVYIIQ